MKRYILVWVATAWLTPAADLANDLSTATTLNDVATAYRTQGRDSDAVPLYQRALAIRAPQLAADSLEVAQSANNLASAYFVLGRFQECEPLFRRALAIWDKAEAIAVRATKIRVVAALHNHGGTDKSLRAAR